MNVQFITTFMISCGSNELYSTIAFKFNRRNFFIEGDSRGPRAHPKSSGVDASSRDEISYRTKTAFSPFSTLIDRQKSTRAFD